MEQSHLVNEVDQQSMTLVTAARRRILAGLAIGVASIGVAAFEADPARADTTTGSASTTIATISTPDFTSSSFTTSETHEQSASFHGAATDKGKIEVKFIMPNGPPKSEEKDCRWGDAAWSEWSISTGGVIFAPPGHHGWTRGCLVNGVWRQVAGRTFHDGQLVISWGCGNEIAWVGSPLPRGAQTVSSMSKLEIVKNFFYNVSLKASAKAVESGQAQASCEGTGDEASATVYGSGYADTSVTVEARASSRAKAFEAAKATAVNELDSQQLSLDAAAKANATVNLQGTATVQCENSGPGTPPPPLAPPPEINVTSPNDLTATDSYPNYCATVQLPSEDSGTITFGATYGSFGPNNSTIPTQSGNETATVVNGQTVCFEYNAPGEVPASGTDTITENLIDTTSNEVASASQTITIDPVSTSRIRFIRQGL